MAKHIQAERTVAEQALPTIRQLCAAFNISLTCWHYQPKNDADNTDIAHQLISLAQQHKTWGFGLMFLHLRNVQGKPWNHKRVYRIYCELRLNLRIKPHKRLAREKPQPLQVPSQPNTVWSMDFMHDQLTDTRSYRSLNILDDFNRELLCAEIDFSLPSKRVIQALEQVFEWRGKPSVIRSDNGPEYISQSLREWADSQGIILWFIQPGNPQQNAYVERFNRTMRYELFNAELFDSIEEAQDAATQWQWMYNHERPNMALGGVTPAQKLAAYQLNLKNSTLH